MANGYNTRISIGGTIMQYELYFGKRMLGIFYNLEEIQTWLNKQLKEAEQKRLDKYKDLVNKVVRFKYSPEGSAETKMVKVANIIMDKGFVYIEGFDMMIYNNASPNNSYRKYRSDRVVGDIEVF